jgi:hypothetical protein
MKAREGRWKRRGCRRAGGEEKVVHAFELGWGIVSHNARGNHCIAGQARQAQVERRKPPSAAAACHHSRPGHHGTALPHLFRRLDALTQPVTLVPLRDVHVLQQQQQQQVRQQTRRACSRSPSSYRPPNGMQPTARRYTPIHTPYFLPHSGGSRPIANQDAVRAPQLQEQPHPKHTPTYRSVHPWPPLPRSPPPPPAPHLVADGSAVGLPQPPQDLPQRADGAVLAQEPRHIPGAQEEPGGRGVGVGGGGRTGLDGCHRSTQRLNDMI